MDDEKLIREVAEKVMGWELRTACTYRPKGSDELLYYPGTHQIIEAATFDPIHNANHWMMVVERMRELGWMVELFWDIADPGFVSIEQQSEKITETFQGNNPGIAVCLASLKAVGG